MLTLSRKDQEEILIPEAGIRIKVCRIRGSRVLIGVEAPRNMRVIRGELPIDPTINEGEKKQ